jgi:hypothetical protein
MHPKAHTSVLVVQNISSRLHKPPKHPRFPCFGACEKFGCGVVCSTNKRSSTSWSMLCRELD